MILGRSFNTIYIPKEQLCICNWNLQNILLGASCTFLHVSYPLHPSSLLATTQTHLQLSITHLHSVRRNCCCLVKIVLCKMGSLQQQHVVLVMLLLSCLAISQVQGIPKSVLHLFGPDGGVAVDGEESCGPEVSIETPACKVVEKENGYELRNYPDGEVRSSYFICSIGCVFLDGRWFGFGSWASLYLGCKDFPLECGFLSRITSNISTCVSGSAQPL